MQASFDDAAGPARVADVPSLLCPWTHDSLVVDSCGGQYVAGDWVNCTCQPALPTHMFLGAFILQNAIAGEPAHSLLAFISSPRLPSTDCRPPCMHSQYG